MDASKQRGAVYLLVMAIAMVVSTLTEILVASHTIVCSVVTVAHPIFSMEEEQVNRACSQ